MLFIPPLFFLLFVESVRTPIGSFMGALKSLSASKLGSLAIRGALEKSKISGDQVNEVYMGQVLQGGEGQAPSTQALIGAGIPTTVPSTTINKVCSSGMKAVMLAAQNIQLGISPIMVAGGMESMSRVPFAVNRGMTFGDSTLRDLLTYDGLTDPGTKKLMGNCVEITAKKHNITREMQDKFAIDSYTKSINSTKNKLFSQEIVPVTIETKKGSIVVAEDEEVKNFRPEKMLTLKPTFEKDGTITAANASKINDGASALVLMDGSSIEKINVRDIAAWELNEAFSAVPIVAEKVLGIPHELVNIRGGSVSLGHPLGSSGSRILVTLIHSLKKGDCSWGKVVLETSAGDLELEFWPKEAPKATRNFIQLCLEGYYDNTIFHRVVPGFIIQGGDPTGTGLGKSRIPPPQKKLIFGIEYPLDYSLFFSLLMVVVGLNILSLSFFFLVGDDGWNVRIGGDSIYGEPFRTEIHSRLRFVRRGLVAMASNEDGENASQFFITLGNTPELAEKATIFGTVPTPSPFSLLP
ncbi:Acetyl-CoA acetyltransferase, mitochondrial [Smittium mucronatum]|uniref:Acetyl-CoA acetyltransferase, mitochondrial n=1 Tax=Smittium mucronatum TaxID=133383 RepID=A0A1R0H1U7_9FUNG|nr:Acetyl-CoA acetyltransferase, mitochondrial [Smittium mucronatum]